MSGYLYINETVSYNCTKGYKLQGEENLTCQLHGTLSAQPPDCIRSKPSQFKLNKFSSINGSKKFSHNFSWVIFTFFFQI